jgi:hypothetical protein
MEAQLSSTKVRVSAQLRLVARTGRGLVVADGGPDDGLPQARDRMAPVRPVTASAMPGMARAHPRDGDRQQPAASTPPGGLRGLKAQIKLTGPPSTNSAWS